MSKRISKFNYRVSSERPDSFVKPAGMTMTLGAALNMACQHSVELPGCKTVIEEQREGAWREWVTLADSTPDKFAESTRDEVFADGKEAA